MKKKKLNFNELIKKLEKSISYYSRIAKVNGMDSDDIKQEIMVRVWKAAPNYNGEYSEKTYFMQVIRNELKGIIKRNYLEKDVYNNIDWSIVNEKIIRIFGGVYPDSDSIILRDIIVNKTLDKIKKFNKSFEVFIYWIQGYTTEEISKKIKMSMASVQAKKEMNIKPAVKEVLSEIKFIYNI